MHKGKLTNVNPPRITTEPQNSTMKLNRISINCSLYNKGKITVAGASNSSGGYIYNDGSFEITGKTTFAMSGKATFVNLQSASLQDVTMTGGSELINLNSATLLQI